MKKDPFGEPAFPLRSRDAAHLYGFRFELLQKRRHPREISLADTKRELIPSRSDGRDPAIRQNYGHPSHSHRFEQPDAGRAYASWAEHELGRFGEFGIAPVVVEPFPAI